MLLVAICRRLEQVMVTDCIPVKILFKHQEEMFLSSFAN